MHSTDAFGAGLRFSIVNLGCKVNRVESDEVASMLLGSGGIEADPSSADLIVVNTCTVTGEAEKKTRKAVRHALRASDDARVVVTGCASAIDPATYEAMGGRVDVVPRLSLHDYLMGIGAHGAQGDCEPASCAAKADRAFALSDAAAARVGGSFPTRVPVKIQDGCDNACTFCIVHVARGRSRSRDAAAIEREVSALGAAGVREIVLSGINLGRYRCGDAGLATLAERLLSCAPETRLRISSIEPQSVDDALIEVMATSGGRVCRHLHLPLQSGSTRILRQMARPYSAQRFAGLVDRLRARIPGIALSTDVIVGFPGETDADFASTCDAVRACGFSKLHVFRYSPRRGTPAAARGDQVPSAVKIERAHMLEALGAELRAQDRASRAGTVELALVESHARATTESYYGVPAPEGANAGDLVEVLM